MGYALLFIAGILGMLLECAAKLRDRKKGGSGNPERMFWHLGLLVAILVPNVLNFWYSYATDYQPQGRYSMPMLIPFMYYIARGLFFWVKWWKQRTGEANTPGPVRPGDAGVPVDRRLCPVLRGENHVAGL